MNYYTENNNNNPIASSPNIRDTTEINVAEQQRRSLRRALTKSPNDPALYEAYNRLTNTRNLQKAVRSGVFISYSRSDEVVAIDLALALRDAGISVWLDSLDIDETQDWRKQVESALEQSGLILAVISPEAMHDQEAILEREYSISAGKLLLPIISESTRLTHTHFWQPPVNCSRNFTLGVQQLLRLIAPSPASV